MMNGYKKQCQSCGMKINEGGDVLGTEANGTLNEEYCRHCYQDGKFTVDCTVDEMIELATQRAIAAGAPKILAPLIRKGIPKLKRWES